MALYCELENIITESDVEQKFIYPFLKAETPIGGRNADWTWIKRFGNFN